MAVDPYELITEAIWRIHTPEAANWTFPRDLSGHYHDRYRKAARKLIDREKIAAALSETKEKTR